jgi:aminoglycoside phosphotransferase (APT) family kinase protein
LQLVEPTLAGAVNALLDRVEPRVRAARPETRCFVHGDYKASQVLIDGDRAVAIDFDRAARGDPALDAGCFVADLHRRAILTGRGGLRDLAGGFLEAYGARADVPGLVERARLARIVLLARLAVSAFRHGPHEYAESPATSLSARLLREAQDCLGAL